MALEDLAQGVAADQEVGNWVEGGCGSSSLEEEVVGEGRSWRMDQVDRVGRGRGGEVARRLEMGEVGGTIGGR